MYSGAGVGGVYSFNSDKFIGNSIPNRCVLGTYIYCIPALNFMPLQLLIGPCITISTDYPLVVHFGIHYSVETTNSCQCF